jgi:tRNA (guanine37-N1)-methyltransferase
MLHIGVITLFPEMFDALQWGVCGKAIDNSLATLEYFQLRDYAENVHRSVDDRPYGGGPGMVMMAPPLRKAIHAAKEKLGPDTLTVYLSPQGERINQTKITRFLETNTPLLLVSGRYEGIDERVIQLDVDEEWSLGDLVLSGGEIAAMAVIDSLIRLLPGALGDEQSAHQDSFSDGLLEYPQYTRPKIVENLTVPDVLLGGNHSIIAQWRQKQALGRTWLKRPDLFEQLTLSSKQVELLEEFKREYHIEEQ